MSSSRRRGRPKKLEGARRIGKSYEGRMRFDQGHPHPMDAQFRELERLHDVLSERLSDVEDGVAALSRLPSVIELNAQMEDALLSYLEQRFDGLKHKEHLMASFALLRARRQVLRLEAVDAALSLALELLRTEEPLVRVLEHAFEERSEVRDERLTGEAEALRKSLSEFEDQVETMRRAVTVSHGWIERFFVYKKRELPGGEIEEVAYGPYFKYRWREGKQLYSMALGLSKRRT